MNAPRKFRELLAAGPVACIGAYDGLSARWIDTSGARAVYISGFAAAAAAFGYADLGIVSQTEMAEHIRRICRCTSLPVIADADTGFGGALNVERTVQEWERAGAAGLHLEDQGFPKRCGHVAGKTLIPADEMVLKVKAALAARENPDFFIIARTDAIAVNGLADAIDRCKRYADAGADGIFVDAPESVEQLKEIHEALKGLGKPLVYNSARTGKSPVLTEQQLAGLGYPIVLYPIEGLLASHQAMRAVLTDIMAAGTTEVAVDRMAGFRDINTLVGLEQHLQREADASRANPQTTGDRT
ncbi:MAG: isocitrate lyase/PEP mutase family protein [Polaromonas sp.]|nr:isocitrate lyase/PEP mutase family protein [Polaromonas sp.]